DSIQLIKREPSSSRLRFRGNTAEPQAAGTPPNGGGWPLTMPKDDQKPSAARSWTFRFAALTLTVVSALAATGLARWLRPDAPQPVGREETKPAAANGLGAHLFRGWTKPDLVIVLSGQQHGYVLPCGCSDPQFGGLERRYNFL